MQRSLFLSRTGGWSEDALSRLLRVLGKRWTLQILNSMSSCETSRFVELKGALGVSSTVLSERLIELEREGLVIKAKGNASAGGYSLTFKARELESLLGGVKG